MRKKKDESVNLYTADQRFFLFSFRSTWFDFPRIQPIPPTAWPSTSASIFFFLLQVKQENNKRVIITTI